MDPKQRNLLLLGITAVLVIASWALFLPPGEKITQGLDIQGGLSVILTAEETTGTPVSADVMERAELIVRNRVDRLGASEVSIQRQGNDSILVQIPGLKDSEEALQILGSTGQLEFVDVNSIEDSATKAAILAGPNQQTGRYEEDGTPLTLAEGSYENAIVMTGEVVRDASVGTDPTTGEIEVNVTFDRDGTETWGEYTTTHLNQQVAIVLDGIVESAPSIQSAITDGRTRISGSFTAAEAKKLKTVLETGALPVSLEFSESRVVGPTLGQDSLEAGVLAAIVGLMLVGVYLVVFYRGLGVVSVVALVVFASIFLGILALLSQFGVFALSLPGIAGVVLTIGLAADSSILMQERFREEVGMGKTFRSAAQSSTRHAIGTSVDADLVTLVSAAVLFGIAIGPVRGFAFTLMIGIGCDIAMMLLFKQPAIILLAESAIPKAPAFWGMPKGLIAAEGTARGKGGVAGA